MDTSPPPQPTPPQTRRGFGGWLRDMPRWKKIALGAAIATVVVGAVLTLTSGPSGGVGSGAGTGGQSGLSTSLASGGSVRIGESVGEEPAAKGVFRLGFSFLAGFCLGSFVRATLKVAAIAFGFWLALTLVLAYYGLVNVDWNAIDGVWNRFTTNVGNEWGSFQTFMTGSLPAAGLAATGLAIGLKRH